MHNSTTVALGGLISLIAMTQSQAAVSDCSFGGVALNGKVQVVESFADFKVKQVSSFPDLKVQKVSSLATDCGQWEFVESFPDFTIEYVSSFEDFSIEFVDSFPGEP